MSIIDHLAKNNLVTERLRLRPFQASDFAALATYATDPDVMHYMEEGVLDEQGVRAFLQKNAGDGATAYALLLRDKDDLVGHMVFHPWFAPQTYEIGWVIAPPHQRQGYATEAARELLRFSFEDLHAHRVIATCQPENTASYRVMEKIGMRREGHFRKCIHRGGDLWWDEYFYAILAEEWDQASLLGDHS